MVSGGDFGNLVLVIDPHELRDYELVPTDYWGDGSEKEVRIIGPTSGPTIVPSSAIKRLIFITPRLPGFEARHIQRHGIPVATFWRGEMKQLTESRKAPKGGTALLREYIREIVAEAAVGPKSLHPQDRVYVQPTAFGPKGGFRISVWRDTDLMGSMSFQSTYPTVDGQCLDAYEVNTAHASHGYGPLIYDVAMELATQHGGGLVSDRRSVSKEAWNVWNFYLRNRPDVRAVQLDLIPKEGGPILTPDDTSDDCSQSSAAGLDVDVHDPQELRDSPITKVYRVASGRTPTLDALRASGHLVELPAQARAKPAEAPVPPAEKKTGSASDEDVADILNLLGAR